MTFESLRRKSKPFATVTSTEHLLYPEPGHDRKYPWRFCLGDEVYIWRHNQEFTYRVVGGELWLGCPHLHCEDVLGQKWRIPQIHASSKTIAFKKG